jgi:hypothetical protein
LFRINRTYPLAKIWGFLHRKPGRSDKPITNSGHDWQLQENNADHELNGADMAKPNFSFQKRQKELDKKKKNEEKLERKRIKNLPQSDDNLDQDAVDQAPVVD